MRYTIADHIQDTRQDSRISIDSPCFQHRQCLYDKVYDNSKHSAVLPSRLEPTPLSNSAEAIPEEQKFSEIDLRVMAFMGQDGQKE